MSSLLLIIITCMSLAVAAIMAVIAWRAVSEEQRRSAARVETLNSEIDLDTLTPAALPVATAHLLSATEDPDGGRRVAVAIAAGALVVGGGVVLALTLSGGARAANSTTRPPVQDVALDLITLQHDIDGDRLSVRGVVRNQTGAAFTQLTVTVFAFDRDGGFLTSASVPIAGPALASGAQSSFTIDVPGAAAVARYRVSFRSADRIVPHVDRRDRTDLESRP
jgi:hypothetical protein